MALDPAVAHGGVNLVQAIVYGILQGLTEFLPISSSAHIRIAPALLGWADPGAAFTANIQLGTILAVLIYFRNDLGKAVIGWFAGLRDSSRRDTQEYKMGSAILVGTLPIILLGFGLKKYIEQDLRSLYVVAGMLIVMGLLLGAADHLGRRNRDLSAVGPRDGFVVGMWQVLSLIPGASRSGSTITGAMFAGFDRATAARFSFLLSVPSITLAALYTMYKDKDHLGSMVSELLVANVVSFIVGYACVAWLLKLLQTKTMLGFVVYRIVLGAAILALLASGRLTAFQGM